MDSSAAAPASRASSSNNSLSPHRASNTVGSPVGPPLDGGFAAAAVRQGTVSPSPRRSGEPRDDTPPPTDTGDSSVAVAGGDDADGTDERADSTPPANLKVASARLRREVMELSTSSLDGVSAFPEGDDLFTWLCCIDGPAGTPYEGIAWRLSLQFPPTYPYRPPRASFLVGCYHPNVALHSGAICLDILQTQWSAVMSAGSVLLSLQSLLGNPNPSSPLNADAATAWLAIGRATTPEAREAARGAFRREVLRNAGDAFAAAAAMAQPPPA